MTALRVLIAGCGDLGTAVGQRLLRTGCSVGGVRRQPQALAAGITPIVADVTQPATLATLAAFRPDILLYAVAAGGRDEAAYRAAYPAGLGHVLQALAGVPLRHALFVSSTRVYGEDAGGWCDEAGDPGPAEFGGECLWQAEQRLASLACGHTSLRLSGIYGPGRRRLLALATQPDAWPAGNRWTNRIHRDDAAGFIAHLVQRVACGDTVQDCYNVSDDEPTPQHAVLHWLAARQGLDVRDRPVPPVAGGKRVRNVRLHASGFALGYPSFREGYGVRRDD